MDKSPIERLEEGVRVLGVSLPAGVSQRLWDYATELLKWNAKVNLTAITAPAEVVEKHLLDSLAVLPDIDGAGTLLDLGAGAGLPGIPLALALPGLSVTLVDTVGKKVAFMKNAIARLGLAGRVRAEQARLEGDPEAEGLARADLVISRAFRDVWPFADLARHYVRPGGRVVAMVARAVDTFSDGGPGDPPPPGLLEGPPALGVERTRSWSLPFSGDPRGVIVFRRPAD